MILTRRQFLKNTAALLAIPAIVKAENIMKIWVPPTQDIEPLPYRGHFRVPDLRGHFAVDQKEMEVHPGREMTATEVLERQADVKQRWANRWGGHMNQEMSRKKAQDEAARAIARKIDNDIYSKFGERIVDPPIQGQEITGVWMDEAQNMDMAYHIHSKTGETVAFAGKGTRLEYVPCDGRELSAIEYPNLYEVLGNKYG
jgi:hypothetical protein